MKNEIIDLKNLPTISEEEMKDRGKKGLELFFEIKKRNKMDKTGLIIKKGNQLIEARYKISIQEQRVIYYLARTIHKDDKEFKKYTIKFSDFVAYWGLEQNGEIYKAIVAAAADLTRSPILLSDGKTILATCWLSSVKYEKEDPGEMTISFIDELEPHLLFLGKYDLETGKKTPYTLITIKDPTQIRSSSTIRLLELLKKESYKAKFNKSKIFVKIFTVNEFKEILGIEKTSYKLFANMKTSVINPAIKNINEIGEDIRIISVEYIKTGKKTTSIKFTAKALYLI